MKQIKLKSIILLILALLLPATAIAYDFASNGIYYNVTSSNTVEVTFKNNSYASYSGSVDIPNIVSHNGTSYTVTTIGDSAFYDSEDVSHVSIPETVISIGEKAFYGCHPHTMTSWAMEAPTLNDCFDTDCVWRYDYWFTSDPMHILYVEPEAFEDYLGWSSYFDVILNTDGEQTPADITFDVYERFSMHDGGFLHALIYVFGSSGDFSELFFRFGSEAESGLWHNYNEYTYEEGGICISRDMGLGITYTIDAVLVEYGKLPSEVVSFSYTVPYYSPDCYYDTYYSPYDIIVDGICYRYLGDHSLSVAPDVNITTHHPLIYFDSQDSECECLGLYNGHITIPCTVTYEGKTYDVTSIDPYTFGHYGDYLNDYGQQKKEVNSKGSSNAKFYEGGSAFYEGEIEGRNLTSITIPNSVTSIDNNAFYACNNLHFVQLTGQGEFSGGSLEIEIPQLDIASGITAIHGLSVNPREVYSYAAVPPSCDENTFTDYTGTLHVPASSLASYFIAPYWCNFANIIGDAVELQNLSLNSDSVEMEVGSELQLTATATPTNANPLNVTWLSSDTTVAVVENGLVIAKRAGECDITAFFLDKHAVCHVKVNAVLPTSLTIDQESALMEVGQQLTLSAMVLPENTTNKTISWSTTDNNVATVDNNGIVTAIAEGECDIVAACGDLQAVCHVTVLDRIVYITLDQHRAKLLPNHILTLTPTVTPEDVDIVVSSSNTEVAAARVMNGVVQVVGIHEGSSWIKVNTADGKAFGDSCLVTVYTNIGDVDGDGYVSISDVTALIDYLLTGNSESINKANADLDYNGSVSIADVTVLIDVLLSGNGIAVEEIISVNNVSFKMIRVAPGTFMMGATEEQGDNATYWEKPAHQVTLTSSYMIGETEVTQELWLAVMGNNPSMHTGDLQKPVEYVTWPQCQEFIAQLNALTGKNFRMPTEAEWEYAARGGNKGHGYKYAGSNNVDDVAWYTGTTTHPVASLLPNELGLYDMSGNVDEWINDYWSLYTSEPQVDPTGPESCTDHPYRGGSWYGGATASRVSCRMYRSETFKRGTMGLRLAL